MPGPRFSRNLAMGESSVVGSRSSIRDWPQGMSATRTPSWGTSSIASIRSPSAS